MQLKHFLLTKKTKKAIQHRAIMSNIKIMLKKPTDKTEGLNTKEIEGLNKTGENNK